MRVKEANKTQHYYENSFDLVDILKGAPAEIINNLKIISAFNVAI